MPSKGCISRHIPSNRWMIKDWLWTAPSRDVLVCTMYNVHPLRPWDFPLALGNLLVIQDAQAPLLWAVYVCCMYVYVCMYACCFCCYYLCICVIVSIVDPLCSRTFPTMFAPAWEFCHLNAVTSAHLSSAESPPLLCSHLQFLNATATFFNTFYLCTVHVNMLTALQSLNSILAATTAIRSTPIQEWIHPLWPMCSTYTRTLGCFSKDTL